MSNTICYVGNWWESDKGFWIKGGTSTIGICSCHYNEETGELTPFAQTRTDICVGGQCIDHERQILYVVDEKLADPEFSCGGGGFVYSFKINPENGGLTLLNKVPSFGTLTSYVSLDPHGRFLVVTNHSCHNFVTKIVKNEAGEYTREVLFDDATTVLYELEEDGRIGRACDVYYAKGTGPLEQQTLSHPHSANFAPLGDFFLMCDKGGDLVHTLRIDRENKKLVLCEQPYHTKPGMMPRYSAFHPTRPFVYTNNEALPELHCFTYTPDGKLDLIEVVPGIDKDVPFDGTPHTVMQSDLCVSPDGKYLYSLVRKVNVISTYSIDQETGKLTMIDCFRLDVADPHSCCLSPDGRFLLVGALKSGLVVTYPIQEDGKLGQEVARVEQPSACSIVFDVL
ncbi:MAG: lactonase family protein [Oscillospiraceae bacterium]